jgi:GNAT superfamily N-acetyltransferase
LLKKIKQEIWEKFKSSFRTPSKKEANMNLLITQENDPDSDTIRRIEEGLVSYNTQKAGDNNKHPLWLICRDDEGIVHAGLKGITFYNWLFVDWLWVDEAFRSRNHGSNLLLQAEKIAKERGCKNAYLDTFSFQAPKFYVKHGYKEFGQLDDLPFGHSRIWLKKTL